MNNIKKTILAKYKNSTWPIILYDNGTLKCKGPGYGTWGNHEVLLSYNVKDMWGAGTDRGPGILYQTANSLKACFLRWNTGNIIVSGNVCNSIPNKVTVEPHKYGVVFFIELKNRLIKAEIDGWGHFTIN